MEQKNFKRTTVTAALPYANGGVHIGHLAGVTCQPISMFAISASRNKMLFSSAVAMSMVYLLLSVPRKKVSPYRRWLTAIITSSRSLSRTSVSLLISTAALLRRFTISLLLTSSAHSMIRAYWKKR